MTNIGPYYRDFSAGMTDWFKIGLPLMQQIVQKIDVGDKDIVVGRSGGFMKVSDQMDRGGPLSRVLCWRGVRQYRYHGRAAAEEGNRSPLLMRAPSLP